MTKVSLCSFQLSTRSMIDCSSQLLTWHSLPRNGKKTLIDFDRSNGMERLGSVWFTHRQFVYQTQPVLIHRTTVTHLCGFWYESSIRISANKVFRNKYKDALACSCPCCWRLSRDAQLRRVRTRWVTTVRLEIDSAWACWSKLAVMVNSRTCSSLVGTLRIVDSTSEHFA